jgi:hypothetical protein
MYSQLPCITWGRSSIHNMRTRHAVVTGPTQLNHRRYIILVIYNLMKHHLNTGLLVDYELETVWKEVIVQQFWSKYQKFAWSDWQTHQQSSWDNWGERSKPRTFQTRKVIPTRPRSSVSKTHFGRAMAQTVSRRPPTAEAWVLSRLSPCGICGGQSGTGTGFSPSSSVFPCQYHSTGAALLGKGQKIIIIFIFITGLHNKPHGCSASVASAAGPFSTKNRHILILFSHQYLRVSSPYNCHRPPHS